MRTLVTGAAGFIGSIWSIASCATGIRWSESTT